MSNVSFKGNVGKVRGLQFSNDGKPRFSFSVAESHRKLDKQANEWKDTGTTWWNVTVFGRDAETLADTIQEGAKQRVAVAGRAETRDYESNGEKRSSLDVVADIVGIVPTSQPQQQNTQQSSQGWGSQHHDNQQSAGNLYPERGQQQTAPAADPWGAPAGNGGGWGGATDKPAF